MAQPKKNRNKNRAPAYSADSMALSFGGGLLLIALGVLIFLAVMLRMSGDVFNGLRAVCFGLTGSLAFALPVFPIWGGVLIIMSTQRRTPLRPFLLALGIYLLVLSCGNLLTFTGVPSRSLMDYFRSSPASTTAFDWYLAKAYDYCSTRQVGGGLLGMLGAWPLWSLAGAVIGGVVCIVLIIMLFLMLIRFDARGALDKLRMQRDARRAEDDAQQEQLRQQELQWQQRQAAQAMNQPPQGYSRAPYPPQNGYPPQQEQTSYEPYPAQSARSRRPQSGAPDVQIGFQPTEEEVRGVKKRSLRDRLFGVQEEQAEPPLRPRRQRLFDEEAAPGDDWMSASPASRTARARRESDMPAPQPAPAPAAYSSAEDYDPHDPNQAPDWQREDLTSEPVWQPAAPEPTPALEARSPYARPEAPDDAVEAAPAQTTADAWRSQLNEKLAASRSQATPAPKKQASRRQAAWDEGQGVRRTASWRGASDESDTAASRPRTQGAVQKPKASWVDGADELPPWDDDIPTPEEARVPVMQTTAPKGSWKPALDLAPVKSGDATLGDMLAPDAPPELPYVYPELDLLKLPEAQSGISPEEDAIRAHRLEETLASFKVASKVRHVTHGPAISRFELELAAGIRVSKVTDLAQNIAMNMEVKSVRIEAPIPGKSLVGVEVPNRKVSTVTLREIMESDAMLGAKKSPLVVALGKDIAGTPIVCDLARMPHLLIAGATGSGKSVCINTMINSILYRCSPKEVRMILVDPKVVELQCYNGIPHLLMPVVSDPHKAAGALAWAVAEMMDRYKKFQHKGVRAIDGYNAALEDGETRMPRIVIIIDELADLMMTCKRDVEDHICRLAQLARAAGIHLVVATQRPSVDVITGLIKANIPSRIAFKVSSFIDSRTILDKMGAEQLLGYGDMLYQPTGEFTPIRIQGCFLSDAEVNRITDFIRETSPANYDPSVIEQVDKLTDNGDGAGGPDMADIVGGSSSGGSGDSNLLAQCIEMAVNDGQVSTSLIQRRLSIGYARAGRLVDEMEKRGIISQKDGAKPRMCLISRDEYEQMKDSGELDS